MTATLDMTEALSMTPRLGTTATLELRAAGSSRRPRLADAAGALQPQPHPGWGPPPAYSAESARPEASEGKRAKGTRIVSIPERDRANSDAMPKVP
jgi:hypothetical protein